MNFLAHIYLSGESKDIQLGNFLGDWIKGRAYEQYPQEIQRGVLLHRAIDAYTDRHDITRKWSQHLKSHYHKYAGVVVDILYDHFLSLRWQDYSEVPLHAYIQQTYKILQARRDILPQNARHALYQMVLNKRLESYVRLDGIYNALSAMSIYTSMPPYADYAMLVVHNHYEEYNHDFKEFMHDIIAHINLHYGIHPLKNGKTDSIAS